MWEELICEFLATIGNRHSREASTLVSSFPDYDITTASALSSRSLFTLYKPTLMIADTRHSCSCSSLSRCVA